MSDNNKKILKGWMWIAFAFLLVITGSWTAASAFEASDTLIGWFGVIVAIAGGGFGLYKAIKNDQ